MTCFAADRPSMFGIRISIRTMSGASARASSIAWVPSAASPTTVMSGSAARMTRKPARTSRWSSAMTTEMAAAAAAPEVLVTDTLAPSPSIPALAS
jgi:hypothetical protein